jgi:hypothetical protein
LARQLTSVPCKPFPSIKNAKPKNKGHVVFKILLIIRRTAEGNKTLGQKMAHSRTETDLNQQKYNGKRISAIFQNISNFRL